MKKHTLQIVCFDNPCPANFGGVIDVFFKIKGLFEAGYHIVLHAFYSNRNDFSEVEKYVEKLYRYKRDTSGLNFFSMLPYRVATRQSKDLLENIKASNAPILFEGLHSTSILYRNKIPNKTFLRAHNIEHNYFKGFIKSERNVFKKLVYYFEAVKFEIYEKHILPEIDEIISISNHEKDYFEDKYRKQTHLVTPFHKYNEVEKLNERGEFCLFHGDLSSLDNLESAKAIVEQLKEIEIPLVIAGSICPKPLEKAIQDIDHIEFVNITEEEKLNELLRKSHINILWSFQRSGTKLKLFTALHTSRYCIINSNITDHLGLQNLCILIDDISELGAKVKELFNQNYEYSIERKKNLPMFTRSALTEKLTEILN